MKIIMVTNCMKCPYSGIDMEGYPLSCSKISRIQIYHVEDVNTIPDWCPLPDAEPEGKVQIDNCTAGTPKKCRDCYYFSASGQEEGLCVRFPPNVIGIGQYALFPAVRSNWYCGEHKPREPLSPEGITIKNKEE